MYLMLLLSMGVDHALLLYVLCCAVLCCAVLLRCDVVWCGVVWCGVVWCAVQIDVVVRVHSLVNGNVWTWVLEKFESRLYLMRTLYQQFQDFGPVCVLTALTTARPRLRSVLPPASTLTSCAGAAVWCGVVWCVGG